MRTMDIHRFVTNRTELRASRDHSALNSEERFSTAATGIALQPETHQRPGIT